MDAEALLGLQQAYADLSRELDQARVLAPLQQWLVAHIEPRVTELGRRLRQAQRAPVTGEQVRAFADEAVSLQATIQERVAAVCASSTYRQARAALVAGAFAEAEELIAALFADVSPAPRPPRLFVPFDPGRARRRPGQRPFYSPAELADALARTVGEGLRPEHETGPAWHQDFPYCVAADRRDVLAPPVWLVCEGGGVEAAVLADRKEPHCFRLYATLVRGFIAIGVATEVEDEWWLVEELSFREYRRLLTAELQARNLPVEGLDELPP